ncbi:MAG: SH3 domain-containing protein [Porcipelethomonas sp.]
MRCNKCNAEIRPGVKFCTNCGAKSPSVSGSPDNAGANSGGKITCPGCGAVMVNKKFCTSCGIKLPETVSGTQSDAKSRNTAADIKIDDSIDIDTLYKRAFMYLEDGCKDEAAAYFEHFLDRNPEDPRAFFGRLMLDLGFDSEENFKKLDKDIRNNKNFKRAYKYGNDEMKKKLDDYITGFYKRSFSSAQDMSMLNNIKNILIKENDEDTDKINGMFSERKNEILQKKYDEILAAANKASTVSELKDVLNELKKLDDFKDAKELVTKYEEKLQCAVKDQKYAEACASMKKNNIDSIRNAMTQFKDLSGWKDSERNIEKCRDILNEIDKLEKEKQEEELQKQIAAAKEKSAKRRKTIKILLIADGALAVVLMIIMLIVLVIIPAVDYSNAMELVEEGKYTEAVNEFKELGEYKDSVQMKENCEYYIRAVDLMESGSYSSAINNFNRIPDFKDSKDKIEECNQMINQGKYESAIDLMEQGEYAQAIEIFESLGEYQQSKEKIQKCNELAKNKYDIAQERLENEEYEEALGIYSTIEFYKDSKEKIAKCSSEIEKIRKEQEKAQQEEEEKDAKEKNKYAVNYLGKTLGEIKNGLGQPDDISDESWGLDGGYFYIAYSFGDISYGIARYGILSGGYGVRASLEAYIKWISDKSKMATAFLTGNGVFNEDIRCGMTYEELCNISYLDLSEINYAYSDRSYGVYGEMTINSKEYNLLFEFYSENDRRIKTIRAGCVINGEAFVENVSTAVVKLDDGYLNVRQKPDGEIIGKLYNGDRIELIYDDGKWSLIRDSSSFYGYVASEFLRIEN